MTIRNRKFFVVAFLLAMTLCNVTLAIRVLPKLRNGYQDFTIFYTGARMLRTGQAAALYSLSAQFKMQQTFTDVPIRLGPLPFNHPPFEALFFVPFTMLSYWAAYLLWTALSFAMLAAIVVLLRRRFPRLQAVSPMILALGATSFFPLIMGIIQGQDIMLLLLLFVLAILCLDEDKDALAGALLGAGLFRPQMTVPLIALIAIRRWRVLFGFVPVALGLLGVTIAIMGWRGPLDYARFVLRLEGTKSRAFGPGAVPNIRGLLETVTGVEGYNPMIAVIIFFLSAVVVFFALRRILKGRDSMMYAASLSTVTAILVSFHGLVYDLTLLAPIVFFLLARSLDLDKEPKIDTHAILLLILLCLTPLYVFLLLKVDSFAYFSLIMMWLFARLLSIPAPAPAPA